MSRRGKAIAAAALCLSPLAALPWGLRASAGLALGVASVGLGLYGTWMLTEAFASAARAGPRPGGWLGPIVVLALKLPVLALGFSVAGRLGPTALSGYWAGLALVYCVAVGWALSQGRKPDQ
jgi:hypothetical protein